MAVYKIFDQGNDVISNIKDTVSSGMWENGAGTLTSFFTSSTQSGSSGTHYFDVYGTNPQSSTTAKAQFSIAYAHLNGSGSKGAIGVDGLRASAAVYRQLSNTLLGPNERQFTFAGTGTHIKPKFVYAISITREFLREKMDPGNWELHISGSGNTLLKFIDDSGATTNPTVNQGGRVFNIVSGSIATGTAVTKTSAASQEGGGYGLFYPDLGIILLNADIVDASASISINESSDTDGGNVPTFFSSIKGWVIYTQFIILTSLIITKPYNHCIFII